MVRHKRLPQEEIWSQLRRADRDRSVLAEEDLSVSIHYSALKRSLSLFMSLEQIKSVESLSTSGMFARERMLGVIDLMSPSMFGACEDFSAAREFIRVTSVPFLCVTDPYRS